MNFITKRVFTSKALYPKSMSMYHNLIRPTMVMSQNSSYLYSLSKRYNSTSEGNTDSQYYWEEETEEPMDPQISKFTHKSNGQELIASMPVIEVDGNVARCTGVNEIGMGHPVEYIALNTRDPSKPNV